MTTNKSTKLRFHIEDDLILLREVLGCNPFQNFAEWNSIQQNVTKATKKNFSVRTIREHVEHLIKLYKKNDRVNLRKSGTEEQYDEKEQLLQQVLELQREFGANSKAKRKSAPTPCSSRQAAENRDQLAASHFGLRNHVSSRYVISDTEENGKDIGEEVDESGNDHNEIWTGGATLEPLVQPVAVTNMLSTRQTRNKQLKNSALQYLEDRHEKEIELKRKEVELEERKISNEERKIALEERKITLQESQFEIEKEERVKRLKLETDERSHKILLEKQLAEINSILVKHLINKE